MLSFRAEREIFMNKKHVTKISPFGRDDMKLAKRTTKFPILFKYFLYNINLDKPVKSPKNVMPDLISLPRT